MSSWFDFVVPLAFAGASAAVGSLSAKRAADAQQQAADRSAEVQERMFQQSRADAAPYRDVGTNALYQLASAYGVEYPDAPGSLEDRYQTALARFHASPNYLWRVSEGVKALERSAAARGLLESGPTLKRIVDFGQNTAQAEYGDYLNRLQGLAGIGQTAVGNLGTLGANAGSNIGRALESAGAARASGYASMANVLSQAPINALLAWRYMR